MLSLHSSPSLFSPFHFLSFPFVLYDSFSHTLYIHPLHWCFALWKKSKGGWGVLGGVQTGKVCVYVRLCFALLCSALGLPACLCLHCCSFLCGLPANFMIYSAKGRGARPPVTTERAPHVGLMISPQKCLLLLGGRSFSGHAEREIRERETYRHSLLTIHLLTDSRSYLGRLPNMDIKRKQEKLIATLYKYSMCSTPMYIWCWWNGFIGTYSMFSLMLFVKFSLFLLFIFQEHISGRVTKTGRVSCN